MSNNYKFEINRLRSFQTTKWRNNSVSPSELAKAGFYFTGDIDRVRCFECSTEICRWEDGDIPMSEHQRWGGRCRFVRRLPCGNVPIGVNPESIPSYDGGDEYGILYQENAIPDTSIMNTGNFEFNDSQRIDSSISQLYAAAEMSTASSSSSGMGNLENIRICNICFDEEKCILFFPCLHICVGEKCAKKLNICSVCRSVIKSTLKVFIQ